MKTETAERTIQDLIKVDLTIKSVECSRHGDYESKNIFNKVWSGCPTCIAEQKITEEREQVERDEHDRQRVWLMRMGEAGIPERFRSRTLGSYIATNPGQKHALAFSTEYAEQFALVCETGRSVIFCGSPGTGKTHLAIGIALHVMSLRKSAAFTTVQRIIRRVKDAWRKDSSESESDVINMLVYPDLLIIDEIGVQFGSDFEKNFMFDLLNERYEKSRPTILISNLTAEEIKTFLGERIYDRLKEDKGQCVSFKWPSFRGSKP